jgi:hypothetical protein
MPLSENAVHNRYRKLRNFRSRSSMIGAIEEALNANKIVVRDCEQ